MVSVTEDLSTVTVLRQYFIDGHYEQERKHCGKSAYVTRMAGNFDVSTPHEVRSVYNKAYIACRCMRFQEQEFT
jgi:hypothetical protein